MVYKLFSLPVVSGIMIGGMIAGVCYAPARWLSQSIASLTQGRVLLSEPEGSIWHGSAVLVLAGGPGSLESRRLPHRLSWKMGPVFEGLNWSWGIRVSQPCCIKNGLAFKLSKPQSDWELAIKSYQSYQRNDAKIIELPAAILAGLGMPWNGLSLEGDLWLTMNDWTFTFGESGLRAQGKAQMGFDHVRTSLTTLDSLGSYRMAIHGQEQIKFTLLSDTHSALALEGSGQWYAVSGLRIRATFTMDPIYESVLGQFLNLIGQRQGNQVRISLG